MAQQTFTTVLPGDDLSVWKPDNASYPIPDGSEYYNPATSTGLYVTKEFSSGLGYRLSNPLLRFDTSGMPSMAIPTSATLTLYVNNVEVNNSKSVVGEWFQWSGSNAGADISDEAFSTAFDAVALSAHTPSLIKTYTLKNVADNINVNGYTYFRLHLTDGQPTGRNYVEYTSGDHPTNAPPTLVVNYTEPQSGWDPPLVLADVQVDPDA